jgi:hypothetical protein
MENITFLMTREHKKIEEIFNRFDKEINPKRKEGLYNKFKWSIEKHFFVEEKAIFTFSQDISGGIVSDVFRLLDEHGRILNLLKDAEDGPKENTLFVFFKINKLLKSHEKLEEEKFYPELDQRLNDQQKEELIERIKEVIH